MSASIIAIAFLLTSSAALAQKPEGAGTQSAPDPSADRSSDRPSDQLFDRGKPKAQPAPAPAASQPERRVGPTNPAASAATLRLSDLSWLAGSWQGAWGPRVAEQVWTAPMAGVMVGSFQLVENDKTLVIELFTLTETLDGIRLRIRHFTPSLVPWEKNGPAVLVLTSADAKSAIFENFAGGDPKTQTFRKIDADSYTSRSEIEPATGDPQIAEIIFHRVHGQAAPPKRKPAKKNT